MEEIVHQAEQLEKDYDWLGAAELYKKALNLLSEDDFLRKGDVTERLGYALYRSAFQADNSDMFKERIRQSIADYQKAMEFYGMLNDQVRSPKIFRCDAMIAYSAHWLASEVSEKKRLLDGCWKTTTETLKALEESKDALECGKTYNQLASSASEKQCLEWDFELGKKTIREAMEHGEQAINLLSNAGDASELAKAYAKTAVCLSMFGFMCAPDMDDKERYYRRGRDYWQKACKLSEKSALLEITNVSAAGFPDWSFDEMLVQYENALRCAKATKDKYLIGNALDWLAIASFWKSLGIEDPNKRTETLQKALHYAEDAKDSFSSISFISPRGGTFWTGAPYTEYYWQLALWETDLKKRRNLLEKAIVNEAPIMELAESTGYPEIVLYAHHVLSKALGSLGGIETNPAEKIRLLTKALDHRNECARLSEQLDRFRYWDQGVMWNYLADLKAELSSLEGHTEKKQKILEEAISDKERCLKLCLKQMLYWEKVGALAYFAVYGSYQHSYGELLNQLYSLTSNSEHQRKAIKAFEDVAESFGKLDMGSRVAECQWEIARGFEALGEHLKAAEGFDSAANNYARAAEKIPQLKDFYQDHALYMQAWSEIEKARYNHKREEYGLAEQHFQKAADLHKALKQWSYLLPNYLAWVKVEHAEDLSRKEQSEEAIQAFEQAVKLFNETKKSLQAQLDKIEDSDEKRIATSMVKATDERREYCNGRIVLEEARILDKKGDHYSSSEKYSSAAETFEKLSQTLESKQEQKELRLIITLSRAWQKMTSAETEASPALYAEASELFEKAKEFCPNEKTKMLVLGNSRFCRALEAGTRFVDTRNTEDYTDAMKCLETASNYYLKAGFPKVSEYSEATKLLFDAYLHIDSATKETDPEKKAKLYTMAEKVLQTSAGSFLKAEHPEKREQVLGLLEKTKKERELALSLAEVLHAPSIASTTSAFTTPTPTREEAVGSERFDHADIQANLIIRQRELKVGEPVNVEIELVNAGKGPALLIRLNEIIPEGFELSQKPEACRIEDSYIDMKGKRLGPLKTEELRLTLRPKVQGTFALKPTILYLDENGKYRSHELETVTIMVRELGIKGWLKGER